MLTIMRMVVVFPLPLGPMNPNTELSGTVSERSSTAVTSPKVLVTLEISTACMRGLPAILYGAMAMRRAGAGARDAIWASLEPVIRAGETYTLPRNLSREQALAYRFEPGHEVWVAEDAGGVAGPYFLRAVTYPQ